MTALDDDQSQLRSNIELIGRENIDDLEAVLSLVGQYDVEGFHRVPDHCPAEFTWDYEKGAKPQLDKLYEKAKKAQWNAQTDLDWSIEVDQERVVMANAEANPAQMQWDPAALGGDRAGEVGRQALHAVRDREPELAAVAVHARRAGGAPLHGQDRRDGAVDRRQVLRGHPGDGRSAPRRGVLQVPRREALGPLPDERPPRASARRHRVRLTLGHDLPRHADHGRGPGAGRLRVHPHDDDRAAVEEAAALCHGGRGSPRSLRRAQPAGVLQGARARPSCANARSLRSRRPSA